MNKLLLIFFLLSVAASAVLGFGVIRSAPIHPSQRGAFVSFSYHFVYTASREGIYEVKLSWNSSTLSDVHVLVVFNKGEDGRAVILSSNHPEAFVRLERGNFVVTVYATGRELTPTSHLQAQLTVSIVYVGHGKQSTDH
ncbi:hypothetical protein HS1genome_0669 [Sulfodiicoccus acidiphilus]|uniref:Uncharacterized protein n=1 Tax=Sulfodiicoccus acidiphilus TaxID=1670455 RepID=A0A348B278_9CREN|nr:hypothetical protein [Sulfodiicoccus acidiphilus]BBD72280.1 hypothetical protein HS1genome_0669 [Sulfodiicoccus acidiphilus]GGT90582.1 hypothetical protein GCM10007116_05520 [Sulfodiicoccus acidiphilus]